jgi:hypothetical protein
MAMQIEFDEDGELTVLAKVLTPKSYRKSLYVRIPKVGKDRRTDGGAKDPSLKSVEFVDDIHSFERGDYVYLTFTPIDSSYNDNHRLTKVERAAFADPINAEEPKFPNTDIPKTCPKCGREGAALIKTEYDSITGGKVNDDADMCHIDPDNRGKWFGFSGEKTYVHGIDS